MYNKYELLWLWYDYHCEKADQLLCSGMSRYDPDMRIPVNSFQQKASGDNALNNRNIIEMIAFTKVDVLYEYKRTFYHLKNISLFKLYEELDARGHFDFIHDFVEKMLELQREKQKYEKQQSLRLSEENIFYDKF